MRNPKVVRLRPLTQAQRRRLEALSRLARLLDSAYAVPGTSYRIGLDPIVGLLPGLGDLVSPLFTIAVLLQARQLGVPRLVQVRMLANAAIDAVVGVVPLLGDAFDVAWKANNRNMELLERHAYKERGPSAGDWAFVVVLIVLVIAAAALPLLFLFWIVSFVRG